MRLKLLLTFLIFSILTSTSYCQDSVYLKLKDPAPFAGFLLPEEKVKEFRDTSIERDGLKLQNDSLSKSLQYKSTVIEDLTKSESILSSRNQDLVKANESEHSLTNLERFGYFTLGVLATFLAVEGAKQLIK